MSVLFLVSECEAACPLPAEVDSHICLSAIPLPDNWNYPLSAGCLSKAITFFITLISTHGNGLRPNGRALKAYNVQSMVILL
jgi:hypothetical protein